MNCALYHSFGTPEASALLSWKFSKAKQETSLHGTPKLVKDRTPSELCNIMNHLLTHSAYQWVWRMVGVQPMSTTLIIYYCYCYLSYRVKTAFGLGKISALILCNVKDSFQNT